MAKKKDRWEKAQPFYKIDNLIASPQFKDLLPLKIPYEEEKEINMNFLMGWEYGRIWWKEYKRWEKMNYGTSTASKSKNEIFRRRYVLRAMQKKPVKTIHL